MPTTKSKIAEQVSRLYARYVDREDINPVASRREIMPLVEQSINAVLKVKTKQAYREGNIDIPRCSIALYENQTVTSSGGVATVTLPAQPIDLINDMGVYEVLDPDNPMDPYIPIPKQIAKLMQGTILVGLEDQVGYMRYGDEVRFTKDITLPENGGVSAVDIHLLVHNFDELGENDPLPLSADYEREVIIATLESLGAGQFARAELAAKHNTENAD